MKNDKKEYVAALAGELWLAVPVTVMVTVGPG